MYFPSILSIALSFVAAPVLAVPMLPEMPTSANNGNVLAKRDACANYRFMSLDQLDVKNEVLWAMPVSWSYDKSSWIRINLGDDILVGGSRTFSRGNQLKQIQRDRNFYIRLCDVALASGCLTSPGVFQIPSAGKPQWVASVLVKNTWDSPVIYDSIFCDIGGQLPNATDP